MVAGYLLVIWQAEVAVLHSPEKKGVVLTEGEGFVGAAGTADVKMDGGGHDGVLLRDYG